MELTRNQKLKTLIANMKAYDEFMADRGRRNEWTDATYAKMRVTRGHMNDFGQFRDFGCFDERRLQAYCDYLLGWMVNTTVKKNFGYLKWFLRWAEEKGYLTDRYIRIVTKKTTDGLVIDLNRWSEEILSRYVDQSYPGGTVFPYISNRLMNKGLKKVLKACRAYRKRTLCSTKSTLYQ